MNIAVIDVLDVIHTELRDCLIIKKNCKYDYDALCDIYEQNKNGTNIRIVCIASSRQREHEKYSDIVSKLLNQRCYVIDSICFSEYFTCINQNPNTDELYYSDWQIANMDEYKYNQKIAIITGGKMTPLVTTEDDYLYCGHSTYSWSIPKLVGFFALTLQVSPNLTYDEFVLLAISTKIQQDNMVLFNIDDITNQLINIKMR